MAMEGARGPSGAVGGEDVASGEAELTNLMAPSGAMCLGMDCVGAGDIDGAVLEDESPAQPEKEQQAEARSLAERAEGLEDAQIWWTGPWTHDTHPLAVNRSLGSPGVAPASLPPPTSAPGMHDEMSNFGWDFPIGRIICSFGLWVAIAGITGCYGKRCCHVSPFGQPLVIPGTTTAMQYRGDKMQAMVLRNNGFCECAPLGGECGCTKWEDTYTGGSSDAPEEKEVRVYECPAPMCCQTGVCAHNESAWGGIYGPPGTLTEWRDLEDTREYLTNQERKAARATQHPRCFAMDDSESSARARTPDCNCCDDGTKGWCNNDMLVIAFTMLPACGLICTLLDIFWGPTGMQRRARKSLPKRTTDLCDAGVVITFHSACSNAEITHMPISPDTQKFTHWATETYRPGGIAIRSQEVGAAPMRATTRHGGGWAIDWRDKNGAPQRTTSKRGVVEVRVDLKLSWQSEKDRIEFLERYARFKEKEENRQDAAQMNNYCWITVDLDKDYGLYPMKERGIRELFFLGGEDGTKTRPCPATLPFTLLGLGWIYQLFWNSINAEIQLPLHKVLEFEAGAHPEFLSETKGADGKTFDQDGEIIEEIHLPRGSLGFDFEAGSTKIKTVHDKWTGMGFNAGDVVTAFRPQRSNGYSDCRTLSDTELMQMMTASPYQDELGCWVKIRQQPLPGGDVVGDTVFYTGTSATLPSGNKLTKGAYGYVKGPATNPSVIGKAVDVFFPGNTDNISCRLTQLSYSREPVAGEA